MRRKKEINVQIGERVKLAREQAKLTQEQLAEDIEVSPQYISDLERGVVGISIPTLKRLCVTLGISSDQILFGQQTEEIAEVIAEQCRCLSQPQQVLLMGMVQGFVEAVKLERKENGNEAESL